MKHQEGVHCMKITSGVFAVLLLVTTVAVSQQHASYAEPFPQSANPALANGSALESSSALSGDVPSSMATNQSGTYSERPDNFALGSPFHHWDAARPARCHRMNSTPTSGRHFQAPLTHQAIGDRRS